MGSDAKKRSGSRRASPFGFSPRPRRPGRLRVAVGARLLALGLLLACFQLPPAGLVAGTGPGITFHLMGGVALLKDLLNDRQAFERLETLSSRMALWSIGAESLAPKDGCTSTAGTEDPENAAVRLGFVFDFGTHSRRSSRVYRVRFSTCRTPSEPTQIALTNERFASATNLAATPILREPAALDVLRQGLNDPAVYAELERFSPESPLEFLQVQKREITSDQVAVYDWVIADAPPQQWTEQTEALRFTALYDLATRLGRFQKVQGP